jgi:cell division protein FtsQ
MSINSKYTIKKILVTATWIVIGSGTVVLLVAAIEKRNNERCARIEIEITGVQNNFFIDKKDVISILEKTNGGKLEKMPLHAIDLAAMETELQKSQWIKNAEIFFDNNNVLEVRITEREPIARVFTTSGLSFYVDSSLARLPLNDKFSPRLPVFTDFPTDVIVLSKKDSNLIRDIRTLSQFIIADPFWMAQIEQIDISSNRNFDLIPKLGNQVIHFGDAENCQQKFNNLLCFYKQVLTKIGWTNYSAIDIQFKGQIVGVRRGANEIKMDSLRSVQIMKALIADAQKHTNDSTNIQLDQPADDNSNINSSREIGNVPDEDVKISTSSNNKNSVPIAPIHVFEKQTSDNQSSTKKNALTSHSSSVEKPNPNPLKSKIVKQPTNSKDAEKNKKIPKAVMPSKTDY